MIIGAQYFPENPKQKRCSACAAVFTCGTTQGKKGCWCADLPPLPLAGRPEQDCLCPKCLVEALSKADGANEACDANSSPTAHSTASVRAPLIEGEDFYFEGEAMVFTAQYLLRRGYCCESGCRHCPYQEGRSDPREIRMPGSEHC